MWLRSDLVAGVVLAANAGMFRQQTRRLVRDGRPSWVVLQCEAITDIDVTAADMLEQLDTGLNAQGIHLAFVELRGRLRDLVYRYGPFETGSTTGLDDGSHADHRGHAPIASWLATPARANATRSGQASIRGSPRLLLIRCGAVSPWNARLVRCDGRGRSGSGLSGL